MSEKVHIWGSIGLPERTSGPRGASRLETRRERGLTALPLAVLAHFGCQFTKRSPARSGRRGEVDREGSVLDMGADSEPAADPGACGWPVPALSENGRTVVEACRSEIADDLGDRPRTAEHQLPEMHVAGRPIHGGSRIQLPGGYSHHHCAALEITADPAKPIDSRWPVSK